MRDMIEEAILNNPTTFVIMRGEERVGEAQGYNNVTDQVIFFRPGVVVREGDWLVAEEPQAKVFVQKVDLPRDGGQPIGVKVFYETKTDFVRQESATQVIAMLDDIADAIWTLSDEKMPSGEKDEVRAAVEVIKEAIKRMPAGAAGGLAGQLAARLPDL